MLIVMEAAARPEQIEAVIRHIERLGFRAVEDAGVTGLAGDQPASDDDCSEAPEEVTELIEEQGSA